MTSPSAHPFPAATQALINEVKNLGVLPPTPQLLALHTIIRNKDSSREDFIFYADRLIRLLVEEGTAARVRALRAFRRRDVSRDVAVASNKHAFS